MPTKFAMRLLAGTAVSALLTGASIAAEAQARPFDIPQQDAATALQAFALQSGRQVLFPYEAARGKPAPEIRGDYSDEEVIALLAASAGLTVTADDGRTVTLRPQFAEAAESGSDGTVDTLVVTAQKREEDIQDVPIAISAFTQEDLTRQQIAGGPDLITQVPNMTFTKTNFSSYSVQLRGIGTQAISATTDPAVAVAFNNTPFIRNRFFEQEFYDLQRVEVLRGPQGTLYGRNATAGVVNIISQKPKFVYEAKASGDVGNYSSSRIEGMVNIPIVEDKVALRLAGAWTKRDGYAVNELTGNSIDGRDLWSTRLTLRISPNDRIDANLIWEHFEETDDRLRSGKQLCKKHVITEVLGAGTGPGGLGIDVTNIPLLTTLPNTGQSGSLFAGVQASMSQGCERASLYSPDVYQTPNGLMLPYYLPLGAIGLPVGRSDPYVSTVQSPDLRVIESTVDPRYTASSDIGQLQVSFDLSDRITLSSETAYAVDFVHSMQDFNRFNTAPGAWEIPSGGMDRENVLTEGPNGAIFCDPQLGCSDRLVAVDVSTATASQFSQEIRLGSNFDGAFNFSLGANFLRADSEDKYYVFINSLSLIAAGGPPFNDYPDYVPGASDNRHCLSNGYAYGDPTKAYPVAGCTYIDPNPIDQVNDQGHNYFLSRNPYKLISYAVFGEAYYQISEQMKLTAGMRWTVDKKEAPRIPTWLLATDSVGYPVAEVIEQEWREPTGRLALDWKPQFPFTDQTLIYGSYAHGYKAGGANPPGFVRLFFGNAAVANINNAQSLTRPRTFEPEFVDAFELGAKNTLLDGRATINLAAFYYDYKGYQVSEIVDRSAFNRNFDADVWGIEFEGDWRPLENLRLGAKLGYEKTRIADGEAAVDLMDRTAGDPNWIVVRPFPTFASSCILPTWLFAHAGPPAGGVAAVPGLYGLGGVGGGNPGGCELAYAQGVDPVTRLPYVADPTIVSGSMSYFFPGDYPGWNPATAPNNGEGFAKQLGGNELPNAPNWTATITADYAIPLPNEWLATVRTDLHWQSESWWRVFNDHDFGKLDEYFTMNLAAIFTNEDLGWNIMAYIKNVTDQTAVTGAFLNSDDTGLTTNVFLTEPRLYGLRVTKAWSGGSLPGILGLNGEGPYPLTVELGGQVQRHDSPRTPFALAFDSELPPTMPSPDEAQTRDLDWGDGREVKITYRPSPRWTVSAGARFSVTNSTDAERASELGGAGCVLNAAFCVNFGDLYPHLFIEGYNYVDVTVENKEEHSVVSFEVGRDVGLGLPGSITRSELKAGLRYGQFGSKTGVSAAAVPDWYVPAEFLMFSYRTHTVYRSDLGADREFEGLGPTLSWDGGARLLGGADSGSLSIDWTVTGGVLFGKQNAVFAGQETSAYFHANYYYGESQVGPTEVTAAPSARATSVTVPLLELGLGLSFEVQRFKIGAGYRWERYFNALDVGFAKAEDGDRTIDGPYLKLSVGFGG